MKTVSRILVLTLGMMAPASLLAASAAQSAAPAKDGTAQTYTIDQVVTDSVSDAWHQGGETEDGFFAIVKTMAEFAAQKRGLTLPETHAAGKRAGDYIKQQARLDHQQLLYPIVDRAVRMVATKQAAASTGKPAAPSQQ